MTTPQPSALPELSRGQIIDLISPLSNNSADHDIEFAHRVIAALQSQPAAAGVSDEPEQASKVVNDSCWKFVEAMPHKIPGPIWNDLKPAIYAALIHYHRAILALRPQSYPLPDNLYDSKDWRQGNYASRVEWLHTMYEHAKQERDEYAARLEALRPQAVPMTEWQPLDAARLNSEEFDGAYWLAMKNGEVSVGEYEWRQGWNPHGFNLIGGGRVGPSDVTHTARFTSPVHPSHGITTQGAQGEQG